MNKLSTIKTTKSSGNVFKDLNLPNPEEHLVKAELAYQIIKLIEKKEVNQKSATKLLGIDQRKISALKKGRLSGISVELLFRFLIILNQDIEIVIKPHIDYKNHHDSQHMHIRYAGIQKNIANLSLSRDHFMRMSKKLSKPKLTFVQLIRQSPLVGAKIKLTRNRSII